MLRNFVLESATAPGTAVTINLAGAQPDRVTFASVFASGAPCFYFMDDGAQAEWGLGVSTTGSPNTLSRNTVIGNTAGTTLRLNFTGTVLIYNEVPGERLLYLDSSGNIANTLGSPLVMAALLTANSGIETNGANIDASGAIVYAATFHGGNLTGGTATLTGLVSGANYEGNNGHSFNFSSGGAGLVNAFTDGVYEGTIQMAGTAVAWAALTGVPAICYNGGGTYSINITGNAATATTSSSCSGNAGSSTTCSGNAATSTTAFQISTGGNILTFAWAGAQDLAPVMNGSNLGIFAFVPSDYRIKQSIADAPRNGIDTVGRLRPVTYRMADVGVFRDDGETRLGLIAHEVHAVIPSAVSGAKDGVDERGEMMPQSVNVLPLITALVQAVQELTAKVAALETR